MRHPEYTEVCGGIHIYGKRTQVTGILFSQLIEESYCCDDASELEVIVLRCVKLLTGQL